MTEFNENIARVTESHESKLGRAKGVARSRIWIEGRRLVAAGFAVGTRYTLRKNSYGWSLELLSPSACDFPGTRKVSGKDDSPIIDIVGKGVVAAFGNGERVRVDYGDGSIYIRAA